MTTLTEYTCGQWSDGTGSNFGQSLAVAANVAIDIMVMPDEVKVELISA